MTYQFIRSYRIRVIDGNDVYSITDNRLKFKINKTNSYEPNKAMLYIFNLSIDTYEILEKKDVKVELSCGYINDIGLIPLTTIFYGNIVSTRRYKQTIDTITELELGDAQNEFLYKIVNKTFGPKRTVKELVDYVVGVMGVPVNEQTKKLIPQNRIKNEASSITLSGRTSDVLSQLLIPYNIYFSIQNYSLIFYKMDKKITQSDIYTLNYDTGLISTEKKIKTGINFNFLSGGGDTYIVTSLINASIFPTQIVNIQSEINKLDGEYKVLVCDYLGDTHDGDWIMKMEVSINA